MIYTRNVPIEDDPTMVLFDMTCLYMNFEKYIHKDTQFYRKTHLAGMDGNKLHRCGTYHVIFTCPVSGVW